jgi:hypothetical protein
MTEEQVLSQILGSIEFFDRAQTLGFSGSASAQFVQALYQALLNRTPGAAEVAGWVNGLTAGLSGQQAALGFLQSPEFRDRQFQGYYEVLLHQLPTIDPGSSDQAFFNYLLQSNTDLHAARILFEGTTAFFVNG